MEVEGGGKGRRRERKSVELRGENDRRGIDGNGVNAGIERGKRRARERRGRASEASARKVG